MFTVVAFINNNNYVGLGFTPLWLVSIFPWCGYPTTSIWKMTSATYSLCGNLYKLDHFQEIDCEPQLEIMKAKKAIATTKCLIW